MSIISTRKLVTTPREAPARALVMTAVRRNGVALLLHLLAHVSGLDHSESNASSVVAPFEFIETRAGARFNAIERRELRRRARTFPERELRNARALGGIIFYVVMAVRHARDVLRPLLGSRGPLLPLALPGLATAAVAPTFLLLFPAEIWDAGLNMPPLITALYAARVSSARRLISFGRSLFLPRKEKRVITEHLSVANTVIFLSMLLDVIGLFVMVAALMPALEIYIFPEGLIATWPTLERPAVTFLDYVCLAVFNRHYRRDHRSARCRSREPRTDSASRAVPA